MCVIKFEFRGVSNNKLTVEKIQGQEDAAACARTVCEVQQVRLVSLCKCWGSPYGEKAYQTKK